MRLVCLCGCAFSTPNQIETRQTHTHTHILVSMANPVLPEVELEEDDDVAMYSALCPVCSKKLCTAKHVKPYACNHRVHEQCLKLYNERCKQCSAWRPGLVIRTCQFCNETYRKCSEDCEDCHDTCCRDCDFDISKEEREARGKLNRFHIPKPSSTTGKSKIKKKLKG